MKKQKQINRLSYLEQVEPYIDNSLIKVIVGQRRVGKSFILFEIMEEIRRRNKQCEIIYIDKEDYKFVDIVDDRTLFNYLEQNKKDKNKKTYLFIDEVQEIKGFEKVFRSLQSNDNYDIYCSGSNAFLLSSELATLLSGRYIKIRVFPLTYNEFLVFHKEVESQESFFDYIRYGGMPHLINLNNDEKVYYEYLHTIFDTIVVKDIISRYNIKSINFLNDLIHYLANNIGSLVSAKKITDYLKSQKINISVNSVLDYLSYLESVFFIERVKRLDIEGKKIFEIGDKFYFEDIGIRNSINPFNQKDIQKILENVIYNHLRANGYEVFVGKKDDFEVDFVSIKNNNTVYIQVTYLLVDEKTYEREFGNLLKIKDNYRKIVISMDTMAEGNYKGIEHWNIRKFLVDFK
jgi:predicted AAA+ superfamily ATPase